MKINADRITIILSFRTSIQTLSQAHRISFYSDLEAHSFFHSVFISKYSESSFSCYAFIDELLINNGILSFDKGLALQWLTLSSYFSHHYEAENIKCTENYTIPVSTRYILFLKAQVLLLLFWTAYLKPENRVLSSIV